MIVSSSQRVDFAVGWVKGKRNGEGASCEGDVDVASEIVDVEYVVISFCNNSRLNYCSSAQDKVKAGRVFHDITLIVWFVGIVMSRITASESAVIIDFFTLHARFTFEAHTLPGGFPHGWSVRRCARCEVSVNSTMRVLLCTTWEA